MLGVAWLWRCYRIVTLERLFGGWRSTLHVQDHLRDDTEGSAVVRFQIRRYWSHNEAYFLLSIEFRSMPS